jgi:hypothetical protein
MCLHATVTSDSARRLSCQCQITHQPVVKPLFCFGILQRKRRD